jgi:hypothetical protein
MKKKAGKPASKYFTNIKKNAGICNENLKTSDHYGEENKNLLKAKERVYSMRNLLLQKD